MKIEIGKTYRITNKFKKSYIEREEFVKDNMHIYYETGWRSGTWEITPQDDDEVAMLEEAMEDDYDDTLYPDSFNETEMIESYDGCWGDVDFPDLLSEEEQEELQEQIDEDGYYDALTNAGWEQHDMECWFNGPITVEEVKQH